MSGGRCRGRWSRRSAERCGVCTPSSTIRRQRPHPPALLRQLLLQQSLERAATIIRRSCRTQAGTRGPVSLRGSSTRGERVACRGNRMMICGLPLRGRGHAGGDNAHCCSGHSVRGCAICDPGAPGSELLPVLRTDAAWAASLRAGAARGLWRLLKRARHASSIRFAARQERSGIGADIASDLALLPTAGVAPLRVRLRGGGACDRVELAVS